MKKIILLIIISFISLLMVGCWDMVEINNRLFPYSIGVDINENSKGKDDKYIITISYPNINAIGKNATQDQRVYVVSAEAQSIFEGAKELSTRLPYKFYFKHLRVLVLGEEFAKQEEAMREVLDGISRDFIINKKVRLVVAEGKAKDLLEHKLKAKRQEVIEGALISMFTHGKEASTYTTQTLSDFIKETDYTNVALTPKAKIGDEDIQIYGESIFKNYRLIGELDKNENRILVLLKGQEKEALIVAPFKDITISYSVSKSKVKQKLIKEGENIKIHMDMVIEGELQEYYFMGKTKDSREKILLDMEKAIEDKVKKDMDKTIEKLQKQYKADALGIGEYISKFHPKIWKEIENDWDQVFSEIDIEVKIDAKIKRRGLTTIENVEAK